MKLGILLTTPPSNENTTSVIEISKAARKLGHDVSIFVMYDGVYNVLKKEFAALINVGVNITVCAFNAEQRSIVENIKTNSAGKILLGSQYDNACIAKDSDRFISFG